MANFLIARGGGPGDRIATVLFNSPEYGVVHFGNARAGSVLVHIPPLYAAAEIAEIV
ncbi:MAG: long-chain fatty acid--CoA ligase, partial [Acidobacteria bacterium]|nr:long-chain fatty acid--CoA ligase [Acidobacteriota bacterium]